MDRYDALVLSGFLLLAGGLWLLSPALAGVVIGALLIVAGVVGARR